MNADKTMTALVVTELGKRAELREMPRPDPGPADLIVKVMFSGVSVGTEMWIASGRRSDYGPVPFINGYQASGVVVEIGKDVTNFSVGDVVAGFCSGSHAQYIKTWSGLAHRLPSKENAKAASLFVQPCVGALSLNMADVQCGDAVLVIGQGLIGQMTAQLARLRGAYVVASDISPQRLEASARLCADRVIDATLGPVATQIRNDFPSGFDVVIESTGFTGLIDDALHCAARHGRFVFEGFVPGDVKFNFTIAHEKQLKTFFPCFIGPYSSQAGVVRLITTGALKVEPLITHETRSSDAATVYNRLFTPQRNALNGIVFDWRGETVYADFKDSADAGNGEKAARPAAVG
jgi:2-desacetyl-2-hydroxyethyl bacteriochlorophyllide A dehydrogenase